MTDERLRLWLNFWKWLIATVVVTGGIAIATTMIDARHKDMELRIRINQEEKEYLTSFLEQALDDNLEKRHRFAQYFANVTTSEEYRAGWQRYLGLVSKEYDDAKKEKYTLERGILALEGREFERARERLRGLEDQLKIMDTGRQTHLVHYSLDSFQAMLDTRINCLDGSGLGVWHEPISVAHLPDFPRAAMYLTLGCKDRYGSRSGRAVSFYSGGSVIEDSTTNGKINIFYPNGRVAVEGRLVGNTVVDARSWSQRGEPMKPRRLIIRR